MALSKRLLKLVGQDAEATGAALALEAATCGFRRPVLVADDGEVSVGGGCPEQPYRLRVGPVSFAVTRSARALIAEQLSLEVPDA